jgi:hypothetical protein
MYKPASFKRALKFSNRSFDQLDCKIRQQKELLQSVRKVLPGDLAKHVHHSLLSGNKLLIYTDSAAWATQLRFYQQKLIAAAQALSKNTTANVQIKILTQQTGPSLQQADAAIIPSTDRREAIRNQCLADPDSELAHSLLNLVNTLERIKPAG